jgi:hypothetical protein
MYHNIKYINFSCKLKRDSVICFQISSQQCIRRSEETHENMGSVEPTSNTEIDEVSLDHGTELPIPTALEFESFFMGIMTGRSATCHTARFLFT